MGSEIEGIALLLHFCTIDSSENLFNTIYSVSCFDQRVLSTICGKMHICGIFEDD